MKTLMIKIVENVTISILLNLRQKQDVSDNSDPENVMRTLVVKFCICRWPFFSDCMETSLTVYVDNADTRSL